MADDTSNPGGYRPDDPRFGLSGQALQDYYLSRPVQFFTSALFKPGTAAQQKQALEPHLAHVREHRDRLQFTGPLLSNDGLTPIGTMSIVAAPDRAAAAAYLAADGYARAGILEAPVICRFVSSKRLGQSDRAPDPDRQMFVCECLDGPDAPALRKQTAAAHHAYQGRLLDRYVAHGPLRTDDGAGLIGSLFIIEVADRAAAETLVAEEPMSAAGVFAEVRITRWRYSKALG